MTANTIADRSTQPWGDAALGPKTFDVHIPTEPVKESQLYVLTPEIEAQAEREWELLDNWVAFRASPHLVAKIYAGESLDVDTDEARDNYVLPLYQAERQHYQIEAAHIVSVTVPDYKTRIKDYDDRATNLESSVATNRAQIASGNLSPKLKLDADDWAKSAAAKRKTSADLAVDIKNAEFNARVKDAMAHRIDTFIKNASPDELATKTNDILAISRKIALEQVINILKSERAVVDGGDDDGEEIIRGYDKKIELLEIELSALETTESALKPKTALEAINQTEVTEEPEHPNVIRAFRQKLFGSFSTKASALYGAMFR